MRRGVGGPAVLPLWPLADFLLVLRLSIGVPPRLHSAALQGQQLLHGHCVPAAPHPPHRRGRLADN